MRIREVEALIGISKKNIRFYEQEGLLTPNRSEGNSYRDYAPEDIRRLKQIKLLRKLDMPIPEIREILAGTLSLPVAARRHIVRLEGQIDNLEQARQLCGMIAQDSVSMNTLDPDSYLERMNHLEQTGSTFPSIAGDGKRRYLGPVVACVCCVLVLAGVLGVLIWLAFSERAPAPVTVVLLLLTLALIILPIAALISRIREIRRGEENDLGQY